MRDILNDKWDLLIAFPPCQDLSKAGARWWPEKQADGRQAAAVEFFMLFAKAEHIPRRAIENPAGAMTKAWRKPDQYVHPFHFGDPWRKYTGLWLVNLPKLVPTKPLSGDIPRWVDGDGSRRKMGARPAGKMRDPRKRSRTFPGLARAMAEQWGSLGG